MLVAWLNVGSFIDACCLVENNPVLENSSCGKLNKKEIEEFAGLVKVLSDVI